MPEPEKPMGRKLCLSYIVARATVAGLLLLLGPTEARAQRMTIESPMPLGIFVDSERERYLRVLQSLGLVRVYPWSIRGFSPYELDNLRPTTMAHPWARDGRVTPTHDSLETQKELIPAEIASWYNTAFPYGMNDGPVWAGRGLTLAAQGGAAIRRGPISVIFAPVVFWAQNASFQTPATGLDGNLRFADPAFLRLIDRPQRFGDRAYARFDLGQTTARVDVFGATIGFSTANQWWGPMTELPFLLGNNAPGFPHFFVGTLSPRNVWIGRIHFRAVYGSLAQSDYTDITGPQRRRLATSAIAVFSPRGLPGLELGIARFFHSVWPDSTGVGSRELRKPFESLLKLALPRREPETVENQLASAFFRWVFPASGFELYGEYGRDDHNGDSRDLLQEPDHSATYGLGFQKAWRRGSGSILVFGAEVGNFEISHLARHRSEGGLYAHNGIRQGHTNRGQLLGAGFFAGSGAGSTLRLERYTPRGRESVTLSRLVRAEGANDSPGTIRCVDACVDVQYVLHVGRLQWHRGLEVNYGLTSVYELNRNLLIRNDAFNLRPELGVRWYP